MPSNDQPPDDNTLNVGNYCVSFLDLLGQRATLRGQTLLPPTKSENEKKERHKTLRSSIGSIAAMRRRAEDMIKASQPRPDSELRAQLSSEERELWDEMQKRKLGLSVGLMVLFCSRA